VAERFLEPQGDDGVAPLIEITMRAPRACTLRNMFVQHRVGGGAGVMITYTLRVNLVDTALAVPMLASATQASNVADSIAVAQGDQLSIKVTKAAVVVSPTDIRIVMEAA
jgi:hypothetical protein